MKRTSLTYFFIFFFILPPAAFSQALSNFDRLTGYWLEAGESKLSYESIFVFKKSDNGTLDGTAYFYNSDDETFEYSISSIKLQGDSLLFVIDDTSIYFEGILDTKQDGISGNLVLDDNTKLSVSHQKVDPKTFRAIAPNGRFSRDKILKKQIDAKDGMEIG